MSGDFEGARACYQKALSAFRELKDPWLIVWNLWGLGKSHLKPEEIAMAEQYLREGLMLFRDLGDSPDCVVTLGELAYTALRAGNHICAATLFGAYVRFKERYLPGESNQEGGDEEQQIRQLKTVHPEEWNRGESMSLEDSIRFASSPGL